MNTPCAVCGSRKSSAPCYPPLVPIAVPNQRLPRPVTPLGTTNSSYDQEKHSEEVFKNEQIEDATSVNNHNWSSSSENHRHHAGLPSTPKRSENHTPPVYSAIPNRVEQGDTFSDDAESRNVGGGNDHQRSSNCTVELQTCISKIKEISYYCNQFSLASLSARDNRPITEREFIEMYEFYCRMDPVLSFIFQFNNNGDDYLTCEELEAFLKVEFSYLPSRVEDNYLVKVIAHFEPVPILRAENCLGMDGLITYLLSPDLSIMNPFHTQVTHDMGHPMTHYFINSSHNSFLTGDQLYSQSSEDAVSKLLAEGVRHLELDLWDGCDGEPECYHGYTSTSKVKLVALLHAINEAAFQTSIYPVILDVENHCSISQQIKVAHYLRDVFKDSLFIGGNSSERVNLFALPVEALCGKIILKCKKLTYEEAMSSTYNYGEVSDENSADELPTHCKTFVNTPVGNPGNPDVVPIGSSFTESGAYESLPFYEQRRKQHILLGRKPTLALSKYLSSLVTLKSKTLGLDEIDGEYPGAGLSGNNFMYQLNEREAVLHVRQKFFDVSSFCENNLVKLTPSPSRFNSSNPDPVQFWNAGIQCVALNQQNSNDKANTFNKALFKANGNSGYYLKPIYSAATNQQSLELQLTFHFVSRIQAYIQSTLPHMPSHRWTLQVEIKGHMTDTSTRYIDCMNLPQCAETFDINYPSMAFLCLTLYEELSKSRKFSADFVLPVCSIAAGTKVVPLLGPSSCVAVITIEAKPRANEKNKQRRKSFLGFGKSSNKKRNNAADPLTQRKDLSWSETGRRFKLGHRNTSTPNLTCGRENAPNGIADGLAPSPNDLYESHCATVAYSSVHRNIYEDEFMTQAGIASKKRSSVHDLAMSSIANLFNASQKAGMGNTGMIRPYCPSSIGTNANYASSPFNTNSNFASSPYDQRSNSTYASRPLGLGLSNTELRAHLFDDCYSPPIYDVPLDEPFQQYSQSCHNSPLHKTTIGNPYDHLVPEALANEQLFSGYSQASPMVESTSDLDRSSSVFPESNPPPSSVVESKKPKPVQKQESVTINDMNVKDSLSSRNSNSLLSSTRLPYKNVHNAPHCSSLGQSSVTRTSQNYDLRWSAHRNSGNGARREPKSVIRGRASSLSDNDCFSSDEEDLECFSPASKENAVVGESNPDKIENDLNLSNLAAEIEEEFGSANSDQRIVSEDERTLELDGKSIANENTEDLWKQQNAERQSNRSVFNDRSKQITNHVPVVREPIGGSKSSSQGLKERDKNSKPSAVKKRFPQRADSYAGHVSPILDDRFDKRTSVENVNRSTLNSSGNSDQFYYQTTMV